MDPNGTIIGHLFSFLDIQNCFRGSQYVNTKHKCYCLKIEDSSVESQLVDVMDSAINVNCLQ